jgi:tripartite-type tricarboxylate transporter receptor subunit TctC
MMFAAVAAALPHMKADRLRALAIGGDKRSALLPDLPTLNESGYRVSASGWYGVVAPRHTPRSIVSKLHDTIARILNEPTMKTRLTDLAFEVNASTPEAFASLLREELATWRKVIATAGLKGLS